MTDQIRPDLLKRGKTTVVTPEDMLKAYRENNVKFDRTTAVRPEFPPVMRRARLLNIARYGRFVQVDMGHAPYRLVRRTRPASPHRERNGVDDGCNHVSRPPIRNGRATKPQPYQLAGVSSQDAVCRNGKQEGLVYAAGRRYGHFWSSHMQASFGSAQFVRTAVAQTCVLPVCVTKRQNRPFRSWVATKRLSD